MKTLLIKKTRGELEQLHLQKATGTAMRSKVELVQTHIKSIDYLYDIEINKF